MSERERELLAMVVELADVAQWYTSFYHDVQNTTPEYFEFCGDLSATEYLYRETQSVRERVAALIARYDEAQS
jgi:hypothetical protein